MIKRQLEAPILKHLNHFPAVAILGPRQTGKTTLAKMLINSIEKEVIYLDLELPSDYERLENAEIYFNLNREKCFIIDEVQRMPKLFPILRAIIDQHLVPCRFILLGSASPELLKQSSETLTGRIVYFELTPFNICEISPGIEMYKHWFYGGFPKVLLENDMEIIKSWYLSYIKTYIERDFPMLGLNNSGILLYRFFSMLAHNQGFIWNASLYAKSLDISTKTIASYIDYAENAFLVRRLKPYFVNIKKRLVKAPKVYIRDSGLHHYLIGLENVDQLMGHIQLGISWENYAMEQIISALGNKYEYYYYRTQDGAEVDLILVKNTIPVSCVEFKFSSTPKTTKSFITSIQDLRTDENYIIIPENKDPYIINSTINIYNLQQFIEKKLNQE